MLGAAEWRRKGLAVPGLKGLLHPHYGVYLPTRTDYVGAAAPAATGEGQARVRRGDWDWRALVSPPPERSGLRVATDCDSRAVACARENAERLGLANRFQVAETDLFPEGKADLVVCNPPWIPAPPKNRVDRAVFDEDNLFLRRFLEGLTAHLEPGGEGLLILSNLAVLLGLRPPGWLEEQFVRCGLTVKWTRSTPGAALQGEGPADPLHAARSREVTTLYCLAPAP